MVIVLGASLSNPSVALTHSTPSLSSTPLKAPSNAQGLASTAASISKPPSVRSETLNSGVKDTNVSPSPAATTKKLIPATIHSSSPSSAKSTAFSDNQTTSPIRFAVPPPATSTHAAASPTHPPVAAVSTPSPKPSSSSKASLTPPSTAHQSSKPTTTANVPPSALANVPTTKSSSVKSLSSSLATSAANVTHTSTTPVFVPHISTSDTLPFTTSLVPSPTISLGNLAHSSGFFSNRGAVGGVFAVVGLGVLGLVGLIILGIRRYRRLRSEGYIREPTLPDVGNGDMHYRRASQMRALGDVLGARPSRPMPSSRRSATSDVSHTFSRETHHSNSPMLSPLNELVMQPVEAHLSQGYNDGYTNGYQNLIPFPPATKPFAQKSQVSLGSAVETSPSIYPPTLPSVGDEDEEKYWRQHGFERVPQYQDADKMFEKHVPLQQQTPPDSPLDSWTNTSPTDSHGSSDSQENELVRSMDPRMEPTSVHKGSTAPITIPPRLHLQDGRYPVVNDYTPTYRPPWEK